MPLAVFCISCYDEKNRMRGLPMSKNLFLQAMAKFFLGVLHIFFVYSLLIFLFLSFTKPAQRFGETLGRLLIFLKFILQLRDFPVTVFLLFRKLPVALRFILIILIFQKFLRLHPRTVALTYLGPILQFQLCIPQFLHERLEL